jgi:predicted metal-binding protein
MPKQKKLDVTRCPECESRMTPEQVRRMVGGEPDFVTVWTCTNKRCGYQEGK